MKRKEMLEKAIECVCGEREIDYGTPEDNFYKIARLWNTYKDDCIFNARDVAAMMILLKIARLETGAGTDDCWVDIAGYAACGCELDGESPFEEEP